LPQEWPQHHNRAAPRAALRSARAPRPLARPCAPPLAASRSRRCESQHAALRSERPRVRDWGCALTHASRRALCRQESSVSLALRAAGVSLGAAALLASAALPPASLAVRRRWRAAPPLADERALTAGAGGAARRPFSAAGVVSGGGLGREPHQGATGRTPWHVCVCESLTLCYAFAAPRHTERPRSAAQRVADQEQANPGGAERPRVHLRRPAGAGRTVLGALPCARAWAVRDVTHPRPLVRSIRSAGR